MKIELGMPVGDLGQAVAWEVGRLVREADGDRAAAVKLALGRLLERDIISEEELRHVERVVDLGYEADGGRMSAESAYVEVRRIHYELLRSKDPSPVALMFASAAAGSYISVDESGEQPTVVFAKSTSWEDTGRAVGTAVGALWGAEGALVGGAIGGAVGKAVDECLE